VGKNVAVLIICNNRLLRESIARILHKKGDFTVIGTHPFGPNSREEIAQSAADIVVLDSLQFLLDHGQYSAMSGEMRRPLKCVLISMEGDQKQFMAAVRCGALGYVLQDASAEDVIAAIRGVEQGEAVCPPKMAKLLFDFVASRATDLPNSWARERLGLTRREQQLVPLIGEGLTNKEIANRLNLSEQTVKNHIHRILRKVGVDDRLRVLEVCQSETLGL
jgi:DNA-binding NarL/FixJ family response regulator